MSTVIRAIIVDDEPPARQLIESLVGVDKEITVVSRCPNGEAALKAIQLHQPQLMFLDIQMPGLSGFDLLEKLPPQQMPYIIFITAYDQYAVRAFEIHALDYLLKPFEKERFYESVNRAKLLIRQQTLSSLADKIFQLTQAYPSVISDREQPASPPPQPFPEIVEESRQEFRQEFMIRDSGRLLAVDTAQLVWLEAANQYVRIHTETGSYLLSRSLDALLKQLNPDCFFRIHRSAVVNAAFVKEVRTAANGTCDVILATGKSLKLSRSRKHILPQLLKHCS